MRCSALLALLLTLATAATATAAEVARDGDVVLSATEDAEGRLCVRLSAPDRQRCGAEPALRRDRELLVAARGPGPFAAAVPPEITAVELETPRGRQRVETTTADGFAARFVLAGGVGRVGIVGLYAGDRLVLADFPRDLTRRSPRVRVFRGGGASLILRRTREPRPDPAAPGRTVPTTCFTVRHARNAGTDCYADDAVGDRGLLVDDTCAPGRALLNGLVRRDARRVVVRLGDGRRLRATARTLGATFDDRRLVALSLPRGAAVRDATVRGAGGRVLERQRLAEPPTGLPCRGIGTDLAIITSDGREPPRGLDPVPVLEVDGHRLLVATDTRDATALCVGLDRIRKECATPSVYAEELPLSRRDDTVYGVAPGAAATAELRLDDGSTLRVPTAAGEAYTGRYAGLVRFVTATVPAGRRVRRLVYRGADDRVLGESYVFRFGGRTPAKRVPGTPLRRFDVRDGIDSRPQRTRCVRLPGRASGCGFASFSGTTVVAMCAPQRLLVFGTVRRGRPTLFLSDGRRLRPRTAGGVFFARLPRAAGLAALRVNGQREARALPPATAQCGYTDNGFG